MTTDQTWSTYGDLNLQLRESCANRYSGTLYGLTDDGHSFAVSIREGSIVGVSFRASRGASALVDLGRIERCHFRSQGGLIALVDDALPSTGQILEQLAGETVSMQGQGAAGADIPSFLLNGIIREEASNLLGPVAVLLCKEQFEEAGELHAMSDVERLTVAIGRAAGEPEKGDELRLRVLMRIQELK